MHQGTSISLLLANVAATPLDREFERLGVSFVRYADDIIVWSRDYSTVNRAVEELHRFSEVASSPINHGKSIGVRLLAGEDARNPEMLSDTSLEFLSHRVGLRRTRMADRVEEQVKAKINQFVFNHLLREPLAGRQSLARLHGGLDRDYVALIWQLRRYLYGSLSEEQLRRLLRGPLPDTIRLGGAVARFPLVDDAEQLMDLDRWIATQLWLALRRRKHLLSRRLLWTPDPWNESRQSLPDFRSSSRRTGSAVDVRMPSTARMAELTRRAVRAHGTRVVTYSNSLY